MWGAEAPSAPGAEEADRALLLDSPSLAHLAPAIVGGERLRAADLLRRPLEFCAPPDPTAALLRARASNPAPHPQGVGLRLLSWNLALLDVRIFGRVYKQSPWLEQRRPVVFERLLGSGADLLLLQELWQPPEIRLLDRLASASGYRLFCPPREARDGLAILLREGQWTGEVQVELRPYEVQDRQEALSFPGKEPILRSFLRLSFEHPRLGPLSLFDTHMQAFPAAWHHRMVQSRRLGLEVARRPPEELVLVGGDLNAAPFYARQTWRRPDGRFDSSWWHNALSLPLLQHYGGLVDLAVRGRPAGDADLDVRVARGLDNDPVAALRPPLHGPAGLSEAHLAEQLRAFTATDLNRLYHEQYAGTEQPARLDHLLARDPDGRIHVCASRHRFLEREVGTPQGPVEPSDHFAVEVELRVAPQDRPPSPEQP